MIVRVRRRKKLGRHLSIVSALVVKSSELEENELIDVVCEGENLVNVFAAGTNSMHELLTLEEEAQRNRLGHRTFKLLKYGGEYQKENFQKENEIKVMRPKVERAQVFAEFLAKTFDHTILEHVIDVAGGRGDLSMALKQRIPKCKPIVIEPLARLPSEHEEEATIDVSIQTIRTYFEFPLRGEAIKAMTNATAIIALHPDEATEAAVCVAAQRGLPFAVVPCCVFPKRFIFRRQFWLCDPNAHKKKVKTLDTFLMYLSQRAEAFGVQVHTATLSLRGCNTVIYSFGYASSSSKKISIPLIAKHVFDFLSLPADILTVLLLDKQWNHEIRIIVRARRSIIAERIQEKLRSSKCSAVSFLYCSEPTIDYDIVHEESSTIHRFATLKKLRHYLRNQKKKSDAQGNHALPFSDYF